VTPVFSDAENSPSANGTPIADGELCRVTSNRSDELARSWTLADVGWLYAAVEAQCSRSQQLSLGQGKAEEESA
jgi:hypothetical protein